MQEGMFANHAEQNMFPKLALEDKHMAAGISSSISG
jgi:hypothetical protein